MPAGLSHYLFAEKFVENFHKINNQFDPGTVLFGAQVPDFLYLYGFFGKTGLNPGVVAHRQNSRLVFESFKKHADNPVLAGFVYGYITHYAFDVTLHPYIYWLEKVYRKEEEGGRKSKFHFQIESDLDVFLFRKFFGAMNYSFNFTEYSNPAKEQRNEIYSFLKLMFEEVFSYRADEKKLERSWTSYKILNRFKADPYFWKRKVVMTAENLFRAGHSSSTLFQRENPDERVLNFEHVEWHNPFDIEKSGTEDFFELFDKAMELAITLSLKFDREEIDDGFALHLLKATKFVKQD